MDHMTILKKALLYRLLGIAITFSVSFFFVQNTMDSLAISLLTESIQFCVYVLYEACWNEYYVPNE
jgi:uncharacterized membrane protein